MAKYIKKNKALVIILAVSLFCACSQSGSDDGSTDDTDTLIEPGTPDTSTVYLSFPQSISFPNCIKPTNVTQEEMNDAIKNYYTYWKSTYLRSSNGNTSGGGYYVKMAGTGGSGSEKTTSEAHGYGMIILVLMAGYDPCAKNYFDGMYNMYDKHRSTVNNANMSWTIDKTEASSADADSATDGDMDIAYALILADRQWGSAGTINYLSQAENIITSGIKAGDMGLTTKRTLLGDNAGTDDQYDTRPSDWMPDHFAAYKQITNDTFWDDASSKVFELMSAIHANYSPSTGLMPDFVVGETPQPAAANFLEAPTDCYYSWNACRVPWRMAVAYAHTENSSAKSICDTMLTWLKTKTANDPSKISAGYKLDGTELETSSDSAFTAPFIAACIVNSSHQDYLNSGWTAITSNENSYFGDTINVMCQLLISGNWWDPTEYNSGGSAAE